jgi:hypothetical protein
MPAVTAWAATQVLLLPDRLIFQKLQTGDRQSVLDQRQNGSKVIVTVLSPQLLKIFEIQK